MVFELDPAIARHFPEGAQGFEALMQLAGERYRYLDGRTTARVIIGGKPYFIKQHRGVGWAEIIKNLLQGRAPILGARPEYEALKRLAALGVGVPRVMGFGERGWNPAKQDSFILMESLEDTISLETLCATWKTTPPAFAFKLALIKAVANIARVLHVNGMNHRDFYLCHFLLPRSAQEHAQPMLFLIDLHRAGLRDKTPERWIKKDLAGLYFSSKEALLTQRDYYRFMKYYRHASLRTILETEKTFWKQCESMGDALYREHH